MPASGFLASLAAALAVTAAAAAAPCAPSSRPIRAWNSWSAYAGGVTEENVLAAADYVAAHLAVFGFDTIVVDGGYYDGAGDYLLTPNGLPLPNATRFPSSADGHGLRSLARAVHARGLRFGAWDIRGVPLSGVAARLPIAGAPGLTLADAASTTRNCSACRAHAPFPLCMHLSSEDLGLTLKPQIAPHTPTGWDKMVLGTNAPSAAASAWYASLARYYSAQELDFIKIDCMWPHSGGQPFNEDVAAFAEAFSALAPAVTVSWSPGDGMSTENGTYIASHGGAYGVAYRVTGDFHDNDGFPRLQQQLDTAARFAPLIGVNGTFPE